MRTPKWDKTKALPTPLNASMDSSSRRSYYVSELIDEFVLSREREGKSEETLDWPLVEAGPQAAVN